MSTYAKTPVCSSAGVCPACGETCWFSGGFSDEFTLGNPFLRGKLQMKYLHWCVWHPTREGKKEEEEEAAGCWSYTGWGVVRCGLCGALHDFFCKERVMGVWWSPLRCKFKCGRDVPANLNVRRWTNWDIQNMGRAKPASGRGTGHNKNQWTLIMDYLWKRRRKKKGDPEDTNGRRGSRGPG